MVLQWSAEQRGETVRKERVLWLDRASDTAFLIDLDDEEAWPRRESVARLDHAWRDKRIGAVADAYDYLNALTEESLKKHKTRMDTNTTSIIPIVASEPACFDASVRASLLTAAERTSERPRNSLIRDVQRYWRAGKHEYALFPRFDRSGGPGVERIKDEMGKPGRETILEKHGEFGRGPAVTKDIAKIFDAAVKKYILCAKPLKISAAYDAMCAERFSTERTTRAGRKITELLPPDRRPSLKQFRYYIAKRYSISKRKKAQDGIEAYEQTMRPVLGNSSVDVMGPGSVFQIDATESDVELVNSIYRERSLGRGTHYFTTDAFCGGITGLFAGIEPASLLLARLTLANASMPKVEFCARYGIAIDEDEWPCRHFPGSLIADRGELIAKAADALVEEFHFKLTNLPAFRPDWKPFVEGMFAQSNRVLHRLPGAIRDPKKAKRQATPRDDATMDLFGMTAVEIEFTLHYNKTHVLTKHPFDLYQIQENVNPRPNDLWRWGVLHRSGALRVKSEDAIRMLMLERGEATVTGFGLRFLDSDYDCKLAHEEEWFQRARTQKRWKVKVCFDRRNLDYIFLLPEGRRALITCPRLRRDQQMNGFALEEIEDYAQLRVYRAALLEEEARSSAVNLTARVEDIVEQQRKATRDRKAKVPPVSKTQKSKGVRQWREEERARRNADIHANQVPVRATIPAAPTGNVPLPAVSLERYKEARSLQHLKQRRDRDPPVE